MSSSLGRRGEMSSLSDLAGYLSYDPYHPNRAPSTDRKRLFRLRQTFAEDFFRRCTLEYTVGSDSPLTDFEESRFRPYSASHAILKDLVGLYDHESMTEDEKNFLIGLINEYTVICLASSPYSPHDSFALLGSRRDDHRKIDAYFVTREAEIVVQIKTDDITPGAYVIPDDGVLVFASDYGNVNRTITTTRLLIKDNPADEDIDYLYGHARNLHGIIIRRTDREVCEADRRQHKRDGYAQLPFQTIGELYPELQALSSRSNNP